MHYEFKDKALQSLLWLTDQPYNVSDALFKQHSLISVIWNRSTTAMSFEVDYATVTLAPGQLTTTTYLQNVNIPSAARLTIFTFNREFYCISDHDHEVSCNGILFFGTQKLPIITISTVEEKKFESLMDVFKDEFETKDNIQGEMLQMLLKRLIIKCTRLAKEQLISKELDHSQIDLIRKYNVLVDMHYKSIKQVAVYADMLNKSPKTLSNLFAMYNQKSPLVMIHERIILEARRLLTYTDKSTKEIAFELGFEEVTSFNKMFKRIMNISPGEFRNKKIAVHPGKITKPQGNLVS